jgi:hypothetical protein
MTFENNIIDYKLEISTIRKNLQKANTIESFDKLIDCASMLYLNSNDEWEVATRSLLQEIKRRKEMCIDLGIISLKSLKERII